MSIMDGLEIPSIIPLMMAKHWACKISDLGDTA